jgi:hypothetical protein
MEESGGGIIEVSLRDLLNGPRINTKNLSRDIRKPAEIRTGTSRTHVQIVTATPICPVLYNFIPHFQSLLNHNATFNLPTN